MKWHRALRRGGYGQLDEGVAYDPFAILATQAKSLDQGVARVSYTVGAAMEYGEVKCSATVTIECPQTEKSIDLAGEIAYRKALELTNDGATQLGVPPLPAFEEPD